MILCPWKDIKRYEAVIPYLQEAVDFLGKLEDLTPAEYPLPHGKVKIQQGTTHALDEDKLEAHRKYLDIQLVLKGREMFGWAPLDTLTPAGEFDTAKDKGMYTGKNAPMAIAPGYCYVVYPEDAHAPSVHLDTAGAVRKIVIKLKV